MLTGIFWLGWMLMTGWTLKINQTRSSAMNRRFPFGKTFLLGFGFFGISLIWPIFNNFVPVFLREEFGLSATLIGFIMTWDNYLNMFVQPIAGEPPRPTPTPLGRRAPGV